MPIKDSPPGFYSYEDSDEIIQDLSDADAGKYYKRKYDYWLRGVFPDFTDCDEPKVLLTIWKLEKSRLDANRHAYYVKSVKAMYSTYCREAQKQGDVEQDILSWFAWKKVCLMREGTRNVYFENVTEEDLITKTKTPN